MKTCRARLLYLNKCIVSRLFQHSTRLAASCQKKEMAFFTSVEDEKADIRGEGINWSTVENNVEKPKSLHRFR
jgi:hypothetical protein